MKLVLQNVKVNLYQVLNVNAKINFPENILWLLTESEKIVIMGYYYSSKVETISSSNQGFRRIALVLRTQKDLVNCHNIILLA